MAMAVFALKSSPTTAAPQQWRAEAVSVKSHPAALCMSRFFVSGTGSHVCPAALEYP